MKKVLAYIVSIVMFFATFNISTLKVHAEGEHQFIIKAYDWNALDNDWEGSGTGDELTQNSDVEPGRVIQIQLYYVPGYDPQVSLQMHMKYDSTLVTPVYYEDEFYNEIDMSTTYQGGIWPAKGTSPTDKKKTNWVASMSDNEELSKIALSAYDSQSAKPLETEGTIASVYFRVKETAPAGSVIKFEFDQDNTMVYNDKPKTFQNLTLNVYGQMSSNSTLNTLSVKNNNTIYNLDPTFVPDNSSIKDYNIVVPNHVTNIDVSATATDPTASVISGTGNQNLPNIGNNDINLIVQAQNGDQEIYILHVYRLNNDATLDSLSLTNDIDIGVFNKENPDYPVTVPYRISNTIVNASKTDPNAEIISGTGTWSFTSYGENINTRDIVVNAENCKDTYIAVPGNSCTSKTYTIKVTRMAPSNNTNLSNLTINGIRITGFTPTKDTYNLSNLPYETSSIDINAVVEDTGKATITSQLGTKNLDVGDNSIIINVKAEDGTIKPYTINVRRLSNNSNLSSLVATSDPIGTFTPTFRSNFYDYYTYTVPSTVQNVTINATLDDIENATIISGTGTYNIDTTNEVNILVQAEDGSQSTYVVKLVRSKSTNNNLKSLSIDGYSFNEEFSPGRTLYTATVSGEVTEVNISAEVEDIGKAKIVSGTGRKVLNVGNENVVQVRVEAENGTPKDYTITITRSKKTVSALTDLKVDGNSIPNFSEEDTDKSYTLPTVGFDKTSINIESIKKDEDSTVEIKTSDGIISQDGNVDLKPGNNIVYVTVTAQDGVTQTTYTINIEREKDNNAYLRELKIGGIPINQLLNPPIEEFDKTTLSYGIEVENNVTSLNIEAIPDSEYVAKEDIIIAGNENFSTTTSNLVTLTVTAPAGNFEIYRIHVTRKKSDNNYLKNILLSDGVLDPVFDKLHNEYTVNVDRSVMNIEITPVLENNSSSYNKQGPDSLSLGENTYTITVTSETGEDNLYTIRVYRNPSSNNYLSDLKIDGVTIDDFDKINPTYQITVPNSKSSITISATTEEPHATIEGLGNGTFDLNTSEVNRIQIKVTAENGTPLIYTLLITREKSDDNTLSDLYIVQTPISPSFEPGKLNYTASVDYGVTNIDIVAVKNDPKAQITGDGNKELVTGPNSFDIVVTSENNTPITYTIVVTRSKNNNANLSNITLSGGFTLDREFDPNDIDEYIVNVPNEIDSIGITGFKQDPNAMITGDGDKELTTGRNEFQITVTAEDGITTKIYTLIVKRAKSNDATLKSLVVEGGNLKPNFTSDNEEYEITVPNEITSFNATAEPSDSSSEVVMPSDNTLNVGENQKNIIVTAEDGTMKVYKIKVVRQPSTNNFLKTLSIIDKNNKEYITVFNKTNRTYNITLENDISELEIFAEADDSTSTITEGLGSHTILIGESSFNIVVRSAANIDRIYTINVFRKSNSNNYLSNLSVENYPFKDKVFDKNDPSYSVDVPSDITSVNIIAIPEVETSRISGDIQVQTLHTGLNTFNITVTAEDNTTRTYIINVNKAASSNNYLSNLTVTPGALSPEFDKEHEEYSINVDNSTKLLTILAEKEHPSASLDESNLGIKSINVGEQTFEIKVIAEDNTSRIYKIKVTRAASSVNDLKSITVNDVLVSGFNKDNKGPYELLPVDNSVDKIIIGAEPVDETSRVEGIGEKNLSTGNNTFPITVTAEDGSIKIYEISINRAKSSNNYLASLTINEGDYTPEFSKEGENFYITVPYELTSLHINAIAEDKNAAKIEIDGNSNFIIGENKIYINVIAENGDIRSYVLNVTRQQQANNFLTSITVTGNDGVNYSLNPEFDKTQDKYDIELPTTVSEVDIKVTKQAESLSVKGDGKLLITEFPKIQKIIVSTTGGLERTYTLRFTKGLSSNNRLTSISVDKGILDPKFDPNETAYNIDLPSGTKEITIDAIKGDNAQEVTGLGTKKLNPGRNLFKILVTAENGDVWPYTIFVNVEVTNNENVLTSLSVDKGTLSPEFNQDTKLYTVDLDESEDNITITATGNNSITGTGLHNLEMGSNVFEVVSTDDNGSENIYRVVVNKGTVQGTYLKYLAVDNYDINEDFNKEKTDYTMNIYNEITSLDVIAIPENKNARVEITGNTNMIFGENNISIVVTDETNDVRTYNIKVIIGNNKITSDIHTIGDMYIKTIIEGQSASEVKSQMTNPSEHLKIYNIDGNELIDTDIVGTGCTIKLVISGIEYDSKILIIKGDVNGDGEVGVADIIKLRLHILESALLTNIEKEAADTNSDNDIGVADLIQIRGHILGNSNLYGKEA